MANAKKTIIITGASSGLGAALAIKYSASGNNLFLIARSEERLNKVAEKCRGNGANVTNIIVDITDADAMQSHIEEIAGQYKIDIVVACAGISAGTLDGPETTMQTNKIFATNLGGVLNTILPVLPHMIQMQSGNIVIVSSMAGFLGLSSAPSYSASKGAARLFGQALQGYLKAYNVYVSTVIPGYIKTPMTAVNAFPMPFMLSADKAASKIVRGVARNKNVIAFPLIMLFFLKLLTLFPSSLISYINSKLPGKPAFDKSSSK
ncbi:MAG: SDR family NAD(P)-dependent oxidoreductase [Rickettsiaceae bacterium]|nr:SDR family NAD(P)-dependent oxidoreductase [Rickettsiaceae bacterium]